MQNQDNEYSLKKVNGWNEWAHRILGDIERLFDNDEKCDSDKKELHKLINELNLQFNIFKAEVNTRAGIIGGMWGAIVGVISGILTALILHFIIGK